MKMTNSIRRFCLRCVVTCLVVSTTLSLAKAQTCSAPFNLSATADASGSVNLRWQVEDPQMDASQWIIVIGGSGLDCLNGVTAGIAGFYIQPENEDLEVGSEALSYTFDAFAAGLVCNTSYRFTLRRACPFLVTDETGDNSSECVVSEGTFKIPAGPFAVDVSQLEFSTCIDGDGSGSEIAVSITDGACCAGSYTIEIREATTGELRATANNGGQGIDQVDSPVVIADLPPGDYRAVVTNLAECVYESNFTGTQDVEFTVASPPADPPAELALYELFGQELGLSGGNPLQLTPDDPLALPPGSCSMTMRYYFVAVSECAGNICAEDAFSVDNPLASVTTNGDCQYVLTWKWVPGNNTVTVTGAGASLTLQAAVVESTIPVVRVASDLDFSVPACAESISRPVVVQVDDACGIGLEELETLTLSVGAQSLTGQEAALIDLASGTLIFELLLSSADDGSDLTISITDQSGNEGVFSAPVTVQSSTVSAPPQLLAEDLTVTVPDCSPGVPVATTVTVLTDCTPFDPDLFSVAISPSIPAGSQEIEHLAEGVMRLQLDPLAPGSYTVTYQYAGESTTVSLFANAIPNEPPTITFPGNRTVTLPACSDSAPLDFTVLVRDDCETIDPTRLELSYASGDCADCPFTEITDYSLSNGQLSFQIIAVASEVAAPAIAVAYTDAQGLTTSDTIEIDVLQPKDMEPPVVVYPAQDVDLAVEACDDAYGTFPFSITVRDNCTRAADFAAMPELIEVTTSAPEFSSLETEDGRNFLFRGLGTPEGSTYTITIRAADGVGPEANVTVEQFQITVTQPEVEPFAVACSGLLNVSLDADCQVELLPSMALAGTFGCVQLENLLTVTVLDGDPNNGPIIDGCGSFAYEVTPVTLGVPELNGFSGCTGTVTAKDLTPPTIIPPEDTDVTVKTQLGLYCAQAPELTVQGIPADQRCYVVTGDGINLPRNETESIFNYSRRNISSLLNFTGYPRVSDNCGNVRICVSDELVSEDPCAGYQILRTFRVTDGELGEDIDCEGSGVTTQATQTIYFRRPAIEELQFPDSLVVLDCANPYLFSLPNGNPSPDVTGHFTLITGRGNILIGDGSIQRANGQIVDAFCNLAASFTDGPRVETCTNSYKFVRTWTLIDWCGENGEPETLTYEQVIKVGDTTPPVLAYADNQPRVFSTNAFGCTANFIVPIPATATDNCSEEFDLLAFVYPAGDLTAAPFGPYTPGTATDALPRGAHLLEYVATDECFNESRLQIPIEIADLQAPVAKCNDDFILSLSDAGAGSFLATEIDAGSYDECSAVRLEVRRSLENYANPPGPGAGPDPSDPALFTEWGPAVDFDCTDASRYIRVELRVWDDGNSDGTIGGPEDNANVCWLDLLVENKIPPICVAPAATTVLCTEIAPGLPNDLGAAFDADFATTTALLRDLFGAATATSNCGEEVFEIRPLDTRDDCGFGLITRRFRALAQTSAGELVTQCSQTIEVLPVHDYAVQFPADEQFECNIDPVGPSLQIFETGCDLLAIQRDTARFQATGDECYQLHQTLRIINWCEYNGTGDPFVIERDEDGDEIEGETIWLTVADNVATLRATRTGTPLRTLPDYATSPSRGFFEYIQVLKVTDNVAPFITLQADSLTFCSETGPPDCEGAVEIDFRIGDACTPEQTTAFAELDAFVFDANGDSLITNAEFVADEPLTISNLDTVLRVAGTFPIGRHAVRISVSDGCGNTTSEIFAFEVVDCKAPAPICINNLTASLMPDGDGGAAMAIWASDFLASPIDDCTSEVNYTIYRSTPFIREEVMGFEPNPLDTGLVLNCSDLGTLAVRIYATDGAGNSNYCETSIVVTPSQDSLCFGNGSIAGIIATEQDERVPDVLVTLAGETTQSQTTGADGTFSFADLPGGADYTLTPYLDGNPRNGVSTYDLILIQKHILGVQPLNSPYKLIAADATFNGTITTLDLIQLRRVILDIHVSTDSPNWIFVDADFEFPNPQNPWQTDFPEIFNANDLATEVSANFIAVKIGDVNGSAVFYAQAPAEARSGAAVTLRATDHLLEPGVPQLVAIRATDLSAIDGLQGTVELAPGVELVELDYGLFTPENFTREPLGRSAIPFSWNGKAGAVTNLFNLWLRVDRPLSVRDAIRVTDRVVRAEAYSRSGQHLPLAIDFGTESTEGPRLELGQNEPNPVGTTPTFIDFTLPRAGQATLTIQDLTGQVRWKRAETLPAGAYTWRIDRNRLGPSGVLIYTLTAGAETLTRKMIVGK